MVDSRVNSMDNESPVARVPDLERINNARKKRQQQIKRWLQYDKSVEKDTQRKQKRGLLQHQYSGRGILPHVVHFSQSQVLLEASARGDLDEVRILLSEGVCPNVANADGLTALHQCCIDNNAEMCRLLLRFGADVNARDTELWTPLHAAGTCSHAELCKLLIDHGADLMAVNADGNMPYDICEDNHTLDLIEAEMATRGITQDDIDEQRKVLERTMLSGMETLVKSGADINKLDEQGAAPLHIAAACGYLDVSCFLLQHGASLDLPDRDGWRAIHIAACWGNFEVIEMLLNFGASMDALTIRGESIFDICDDEEVHARLVSLKADLERRQQQQAQQLSLPCKDRALIRRRGSNPRSASVRRSSMREKSEMSWKEAKQEVEMYALPVPSEETGRRSGEESRAPAWMVSPDSAPLSPSAAIPVLEGSRSGQIQDSASRSEDARPKHQLTRPTISRGAPVEQPHRLKPAPEREASVDSSRGPCQYAPLPHRAHLAALPRPVALPSAVWLPPKHRSPEPRSDSPFTASTALRYPSQASNRSSSLERSSRLDGTSNLSQNGIKAALNGTSTVSLSQHNAYYVPESSRWQAQTGLEAKTTRSRQSTGRSHHKVLLTTGAVPSRGFVASPLARQNYRREPISVHPGLESQRKKMSGKCCSLM